MIDETNHSFPFLYSNPAYNLTKYLRGPAVVAVIEMDYPQLMQRSFSKDPIRIPSIYEYVQSGM
ncbi:hypothetical protein PACILC2_40010 [Paenibacillus cisolokensis]|uniref:Uncharacterized protein n=1 Tax=Paenibacillus cisolokensis TaxID=1658519 RepID=A0ABQ4NBT3_9BACL|nr:hypothetical protein PACILC2_40010 [Paenibacillus cisolokensis]